MKVLENNESNMNNKNPGGGITADMLKGADDIKCENCECLVFEEKIIIKKISKFITGSAQDSIAPMPVFACASCNHINEMFKPQI